MRVFYRRYWQTGIVIHVKKIYIVRRGFGLTNTKLKILLDLTKWINSCVAWREVERETLWNILHLRTEETLQHCYHRSYTSERGQGSVWNWVTEADNVARGGEKKAWKRAEETGQEIRMKWGYENRQEKNNEHTRTWYKRLLTEWSTKHNFFLLDQFITAVKSLHTHLHLAAPLLLLPHHLLRNIIRLMHYCKSISWIDWGHCGVAHKSQPTAVW